MDQLFNVKEIAEAVGTTVRWINVRSRKENWKARIVNGRREKRFSLRDLPSDVQTALVAKQDVSPSFLPMLAPEAALAAATRMVPEFSFIKGIAGNVPNSQSTWAGSLGLSSEVVRDPRVGKIVRMIQDAQNVPRDWKRRAWIEAVAVKNGTTFQSLYRYMARYETKGLAGLHHTKANRGCPRPGPRRPWTGGWGFVSRRSTGSWRRTARSSSTRS